MIGSYKPALRPSNLPQDRWTGGQVAGGRVLPTKTDMIYVHMTRLKASLLYWRFSTVSPAVHTDDQQVALECLSTDICVLTKKRKQEVESRRNKCCFPERK